MRNDHYFLAISIPDSNVIADFVVVIKLRGHLAKAVITLRCHLLSVNNEDHE